MKKKHDEGFSLVEVLLSMVLLAAIVIPTCTSLVMSFQLNEKASEMARAQLAVSSAVETLMAEGITVTGEVPDDYGANGEQDRFPDVVIKVTEEGGCYSVVVTDNAGLVTVTTKIRGGTP